MVTKSQQSELAQRVVYSQMFKPTYNGALANHLPMAIIAMDALGASIEEVDHFIDQYRYKLEALEPVDFNITSDNWVDFLGQRDAFYAYRQYFLRRIERHGWQQVVAGHLGPLLEGICASAFHCLIRLGFGIRQGSPSEVAIALAFFAAEYQSLGNTLQRSGNRVQLGDVLGQLTGNAHLRNSTFEAQNIIERLNRVAANRSYQTVVAQLDGCTLELSELADLALRLFATTRDFSALHGVTSCHGLRLLMPYVNDEQRCLKLYARALLAVYVSMGVPAVVQWRELDVSEFSHRSWEWIFAQAIDSYNDHKIKMVFSCYDEFQAYHHDGYQYCAALAIESDV